MLCEKNGFKTTHILNDLEFVKSTYIWNKYSEILVIVSLNGRVTEDLSFLLYSLYFLNFQNQSNMELLSLNKN